VSQLRDLIDQGQLRAEEIQGIIAQTEGIGYARGYTSLCMQLVLSQALGISTDAVFERIPMMMIGLCGGLMSPHYTIFSRRSVPTPAQPPADKRLTVGIAHTRKLLPEEYGRSVQVQLVSKAVTEAIAAAGITDLEDVQCVEIKCPAMTPGRIQEAKSGA